MAATSVTGVGPGMSNGKQKPGNHCGCGCGGEPEETTTQPLPPRGCVISYRSGNKVSIRTGNKVRTKVCG